MNDSGLLFEDQSPKIYTVSLLTEKIKQLLEDHFDFLWVEGEISNFRAPSSGHYYMVLKDEKAQIRAVMFRLQNRYLKFTPEDGMKVIAQGRVGVYQPRGEYQIILDYLEPLGIGALALAFEQLKKKLAAQGIFDDEVKKPLPFLPQRVAVITSPTGAAIRDFLKIIHRRFANIEITIVPVKVQGDEATAKMVEALEVVNRKLDVDIIVLTRGGGSLEDLWAFNKEELALAIRASHIPVVSAVGHEIDITISDLAADFRAPTPSAAAELLVLEKASLRERLETIKGRLKADIKTYLDNMNQRLTLISKGLRDPRKRIADSLLRLDELNSRLLRLIDLIIKERHKSLAAEYRTLLFQSPMRTFVSLRQRIDFQRRSLTLMISKKLGGIGMVLSLLEERIKDLSPLSVLKRGYSITRKMPEEVILKGVSGVKKGDQVNVTLAEGELECRIEKTTQGKG
ncbi:MAG: exodeoxyribonuclease VII large subunit [Desulfatiglandales bacterium]|jgi:exodeoxyribonuclease VII large subunit|nr:exodeoxyribonuclease VII large subunit [Desulfatiglandales bacterium]